jgi:hypothetical protein
MDSILLAINSKTSAPPSTDDAPDAPPPLEQFQAVMKRLSDGFPQSASSGKAKSPRANPPGVRSHKDVREHKPDSSQAAGSKTTHDGHQTAAVSATGSASTSHTFISLAQVETATLPANKLSNDSPAVASAAGAGGKMAGPAKSGAMGREQLPLTNFQGTAAPANGKAGSGLQAGAKAGPAARSAAADDLAPGSPPGPAALELADLQRLSASAQAGAGLYPSADVTVSGFKANTLVPGAARLSDGMIESDISFLAGTEIHPGQADSVEPDVQTAGTQISPSAMDGNSRAGDSNAVAHDAAAKTINSNIVPGSPQNSSIPAVANNSPTTPPATLSHAPVAAEIAGATIAAKNPPAEVALKDHGDLASLQASVPTQNAHGTAVAQQSVQMKTAAKQNKFTGVSGQKLPGNSASSGRTDLPAFTNRAILPTSNPAHGPLTSAIAASTATGDAAAKTTSPVLTNGSPVSSSPAQMVARTQDLLAMQVMQLHQSGLDSLRVVIKPDTNLQLSLQLQQHNGGIDMQVRMDHGDYTLLNQHWAALQQHFELRGIRVAPLTTEASFSGSGGEDFQQSPQSHGQSFEEEAVPAGSGASLVSGYPLPALAASGSAPGTEPRRWETWA